MITEQLSLAAPQVHVLERDASPALQVHTVAAEDGHRARPTCDGRTDLLQLRCGLENLHGRLDTYMSPTTRNERRTVTSANSRSIAPAERPARPILGAQLMISKALQRTTPMTIMFNRVSDMTGLAVWPSAAVKMHACCPVYGRAIFVRFARITGRRAKSRRSVS
jgi:hypothetical protein